MVKILKAEYACDCCGKMLLGYGGTHYHSRDYITIKGSISLQLHDPDTNHRYFIYVTPRGKEMITVCDTDCLKGYIELNREYYEEKRRQKLREEASAESLARLDYPQGA